MVSFDCENSKSILIVLNRRKKYDLNALKFNSNYIFYGDKNKIKNCPFGKETNLLILFNVASKEFIHLQLFLDTIYMQIYYRYVYDGTWTNWIMLSSIQSSKEFINSVRKFSSKFENVFARENSIEELSKKVSVLEDVFNTLEKENGIFSTTIRNDQNLFKELNNRTLVSFIDDDSSIYLNDIWYDICEMKSIKIGIACITGYLDQSVDVTSDAYEQISLEELERFYREGFDLYSHSQSHYFFYEPRNTSKNIEYECCLSKKFLLEKGFYRGSDIIVYPGGLGYQRIKKKSIVQKYYRYGVDTVGRGFNEIPFDNYCVHRYNLDVANIDDIKKTIDLISNNNCLFVFMSHSYELNKEKESQKEKIAIVIDYIKSKGICIVPLSQAIKIKNYLNVVRANRKFSFKIFLKEVRADFKNIFKQK